MKFSLFASKPKSKSLKLCPWNTKQKTASPDLLRSTLRLIRVTWLVAVRHVAGSVAHEAHWPNPLPLLVPLFTPDPSLCLESCLLPPGHSFLNCFTWNYCGRGHSGIPGQRYSFSFEFLHFFQPFVRLILLHPCTPTLELSLAVCCIVLRFYLTPECLVFSLFPLSCSVLRTSYIICRAPCLKMKNFKMANIEH